MKIFTLIAARVALMETQGKAIADFLAEVTFSEVRASNINGGPITLFNKIKVSIPQGLKLFSITAFCCLLMLCSNLLFAQAPTISGYKTPITYVNGVAINNNTPTISGTFHPYGQVSTVPITGTITANGVAVDTYNNLIWTSDGADVRAFSESGGTYIYTLTAATTVYGMCFDAVNNNVYFSTGSGGSVTSRLYSINVSNLSSLSITSLTGSTSATNDGASNICTDGTYIYWVSDGDSKIFRYDLFGGTGIATVASLAAGTYGDLGGVLYDPSNKTLAFSCFQHNTIYSLPASSVGATTATLIAGTGTLGSTDGTTWLNSTFDRPGGMAIDAAGNYYVLEEGATDQDMRKLDAGGGRVSHVTAANAVGLVNGDGSVAKIHIIVVGENFGFDSTGKYLFFADNTNNVIRQITDYGDEITFSPILANTNQLVSSGTTTNGLVFNYTTGVISGTPTIQQKLTTYTATITSYGYGSSSTQVQIAIIGPNNYDWTGASTTNMNTAANWVYQGTSVVPPSLTSTAWYRVGAIPYTVAANQPILSAAMSMDSLTIGSYGTYLGTGTKSSSINMNGQTLTINKGFEILDTASLTILNTSATLGNFVTDGTAYLHGLGNIASVTNTKINNSAGYPWVFLGYDADELSSNYNTSSILGPALGQFDSKSSFVGQVMVTRPILQSNGRAYRIMSSPVYSALVTSGNLSNSPVANLQTLGVPGSSTYFDSKSLVGQVSPKPTSTGPIWSVTDPHATNGYNEGLSYITKLKSPFLAGPATGVYSATGNSIGWSETIANSLVYLFREDRNSPFQPFTGGYTIGVTDLSNQHSDNMLYYTTGIFSYSGQTSIANNLTKGYFPAGNGYFEYITGNGVAATAVGSTVDANLANVYVGTPNQGSIPFRLWFDSSNGTSTNYQDTLSYTSTDVRDAGFNLLGNPYPCPIDWETFSTSSSTAGMYGPSVTTATAYELNGINRQYGTCSNTGVVTNGGSRYINIGEGFFVRASKTGGAFTFNETAKVIGQSTNLPTMSASLFKAASLIKTSVPQTLKIAMGSATNPSPQIHDDIVFEFTPTGSNAFLNEEDIVDLGGNGAPIALSALDSTGTHLLAVKELPPITLNSTGRLYVSAIASGGYTLTGSDFQSLDERYDAYLVDAYKKDTVLFSKGPYTFSIDLTDTATYGVNRFSIIFKAHAFPKYTFNSIYASKVSNNIKVTWNVTNEGNYTTFVAQKETATGTWADLTTIQSNGAGTYSYTDTKINDGANIYRVGQIDINNNITYSQSVNVNTGADILSVYPNPTIGPLNISVNLKPAIYSMNIYSEIGTLVRHLSLDGNNLFTDVSSFSAGTYIIELAGSKGGFIGKAKFVKLK